MKIEIKPTEKIQLMKEQLEKRKGNAQIQGEKVVIEAENTEFLEKTPGIEEYTVEGETKEGLKGRPLQEQAYIRIEDREDAVKALLATMDGYDLVVLNSDRKWDLRKLREYNPGIKQLKTDEPKEFLDIEQAIGDIEGLKQVEIEVSDEELDLVYREMLA
ncbi:hypothetical protein AQV86_04850 [Nanohaloarchaea archaeon SG9]|nr:hypothetical protein AQV86_04850 [Nanohaloarchaea archaeon SG9]